MPWLLALSALLGTGFLFLGEARKSGLTPLDSQANERTAAGSLDGPVDKVSTAAAAGLLLVSGAFAYSLVKR